MRGSTTAVFVLGFTMALLLVVSSGAVVLNGPTDSIDDDVALQPSDNPYASLNENGKLAIDISEDNPSLDADGVNPDAFSAQDELFYITYNGSEYVNAWIEHDAEAVTFVVDGQPIESKNDSVRLAPDDNTTPVGITVDTRIADITPGDRLIDEIAVNAQIAEPEDLESKDDDDDDDSYSGPTVTVNAPEPTARQVEVYSVAVNDETEVDLSGLQVGGPSIRLDRLSFAREEPGDVEFSIKRSADAPAKIDSVDRPGVNPLGYYVVAFSEPDQQIESATAEVVVERDRLKEAGVDPGQLAAYHETGNGDDWNATDLRVIAETEETVRFAIESDRFSAFALGVQHSAFDPIDVELASNAVAPGEPARLNVTLTNVGPAPAEDVEVSVRAVRASGDNPDPVDAERIAVNAESDETVMRTLTVELDEPGEYDLIVDGERVIEPESVASLTVQEPESEPTDSDNMGGTGAESNSNSETESTLGTDSDGAGTDDAETSVESLEPSGFDLEDLAGLAMLIAIILATLFLIRRAPK